MKTAKPTAQQVKQKKELQRHIFDKACSLLPPGLADDLQRLLRKVDPNEVFNSRGPLFYAFEKRWVDFLPNKLLKEKRYGKRSLSQTEIACVSENRELFAKLFKMLRPEYKKLKNEYIQELAKIFPGQTGPTYEEFQEIKASAFRATLWGLFMDPHQRSIERRFIENSLQALPLRLHSQFIRARGGCFFYKHLKPFRPYIGEAEQEFIRKMALHVLRQASFWKSRGLGNLLKDNYFVKAAFKAAIENGDLKFFLQVGDVLRRRQDTRGLPMSVGDLAKQENLTNLQVFLVNYWVQIDDDDEITPLYNLSIPDLCDRCRSALNVEGLTPHAVEKARQRLGLVTFRAGCIGRPNVLMPH